MRLTSSKPNFRAYVSYNFNLIDEGDAIYSQNATTGVYFKVHKKLNAEDEVVLGMRYDFLIVNNAF